MAPRPWMEEKHYFYRVSAFCWTGCRIKPCLFSGLSGKWGQSNLYIAMGSYFQMLSAFSILDFQKLVSHNFCKMSFLLWPEYYIMFSLTCGCAGGIHWYMGTVLLLRYHLSTIPSISFLLMWNWQSRMMWGSVPFSTTDGTTRLVNSTGLTPGITMLV